jgi:hypothetical protein
MRPGTRAESVTVAEAVRDAAQACDPEQRSDGVRALMVSFEGDERPATAAEDLAGELRSAAREIDPEGDDPAARAVPQSGRAGDGVRPFPRR